MSSISAGTTSTTTLVHSGDTTGSLVFKTNDTGSGGTTAVTIDTSQNVGIGGTPAQKLDVIGSGSRTRWNVNNSYVYQVISNPADSAYAENRVDALQHTWYVSNSERMRIDTSGNLLVGRTAQTPYTNVGFTVTSSGRTEITRVTGGDAIAFYVSASGNNVGTIVTNASTTSYNTSSDYRLKENIVPMTGALAKVALLKPSTYKWKVDGADGEGFIAHELAEVCPHAVNGEKDAVDANGKPIYQGIDTSFLVATLTAAIQELKAINDQQAETINALTARLVALESK